MIKFFYTLYCKMNSQKAFGNCEATTHTTALNSLLLQHDNLLTNFHLEDYKLFSQFQTIPMITSKITYDIKISTVNNILYVTMQMQGIKTSALVRVIQNTSSLKLYSLQSAIMWLLSSCTNFLVTASSKTCFT